MERSRRLRSVRRLWKICTEMTRRTRTQKVKINRQMIQIFVKMNGPKEFLLTCQ